MTTRMRAGLLASAASAVAAGLVAGVSLVRSEKHAPMQVEIRPAHIAADGYDAATLAIRSNSSKAPRISLSGNAHGVAIQSLVREDSVWRARIRAGVLPGRVELQVESPGRTTARAALDLVLDTRDTAGDGTPDFLRLDSDHDREEFRRWFTYVAESQYFQPAEARPAEINDCAALIRYAYRAALHAHDDAWNNSVNLPVIPAFDSVEKYQYPFTPLGASLFRARAGSFEASDLKDGTFLQFADARTLWRFNTHFVSRDINRAQPGDLLFYRQETNHVTYHSMIYLGASQLQSDGQRYVLYHTGPTGSNPGEIRRLTIDELLRFPQLEWRPLQGNQNFLGVARWNILRGHDEGTDVGAN